jgi:hypothetical protein
LRVSIAKKFLCEHIEKSDQSCEFAPVMRDFETAHSLSKSHHRIFIARSDPLQSGRDHRPGIPEVRLAIQPMDRIVPA